ncbi:MAG: F0F1 ATP synthase subunit delta [Coriobacteriia bacterium]|nr:F0F1 ATP synthase subunit delta [Coriobacteriia bacterium]MCL2537054.1 F0F1 ATP synthase subunit delta [Coriobacteriia bacterium]
MASVSGRDVLVVYVVTATPLSDEARAKIVEKLTKERGQLIQLVERISPSVMGGVRIHYGDYIYDATVAKQLKDVKQTLIAAGEAGS